MASGRLIAANSVARGFESKPQPLAVFARSVGRQLLVFLLLFLTLMVHYFGGSRPKTPTPVVVPT